MPESILSHLHGLTHSILMTTLMMMVGGGEDLHFIDEKTRHREVNLSRIIQEMNDSPTISSPASFL